MRLFSLAVPHLEGAACIGRDELFDQTIDGRETYAVRAALTLCRACPCLVVCAEWLESLPPKERPYGVTGGQVRIERKQRTRKESTHDRYTTGAGEPHAV